MRRKEVMNAKYWCPVRPADQNGLTQGGNFQFATIRHHHRFEVNVLIGNLAGDLTFTMLQAKNIGGGSNKALGFTKIFRCQCAAGDPREQDKFYRETVAGNSLTVSGGNADNSWWKLSMKSDELDVSNNFDCIRPNLVMASAAGLIACWVEFHDPRFQGTESDTNVFPSVLVGNEVSA